jgi:general secretion pathway protein G
VRTKESLLHSSLFTLRTLVDEYTYDKQEAPQPLQDLVAEAYLRETPFDPITGSNSAWRVIMEEANASANLSEPGIFDVRSGSDKTNPLDGTPYAEWSTRARPRRVR